MSSSALLLEQPALVLNRHWVPIHLTTSRHALTLLYQRVARAVDPLDCTLHRFQSWADLAVPEDVPCVRTVTLRIRVPEIVVLERYGQIPKRSVPFNRKNLFDRDRNTCQYCGHHDVSQELTIDHVVPRSRGGTSHWENCVIACLTCNLKKGNRLIEEAGLHLRRRPRAPRWTPHLLLAEIPRKDTWERVIGEAYWNVPLEA
jgi:5-methylcytosine-specific restriction endonuclease McrA